jgi:hypothetical protein
LLAENNESREWRKVRDLANARRAIVVSDLGEANLMFPEFEMPTAGSLMPGIALPTEVRREARRIDRAEIIVVPRNHTPFFYSIVHALVRTTKVFDGEYFTVYERARTK